MNLQQIPNGVLKDLPFINDMFLYGNKLTSLPSSISHLTNLRRLLLQQNMITTSGLPGEITKLRKLEQLDLRYNRLEGPLPTVLCNLESLEHLILTYNKLTSIVPEISNLKVCNLNYLLVCFVVLLYLIVYLLILKKNLSVLIVNRNQIRQDLPESIWELSKLSTLDLSYNHITSLPES